MTNAHTDQELDFCRAACGAPPRRFGLWTRLTYLRVAQPAWTRHDDLAVFFERRERLLRDGRLTWGHVVQANELLFRPGDHDCPGEVVYPADPRAPLAPEALGAVARRLFALKGTRQFQPGFRKFSEYLADERIRVFGLRVPDALSPEAPCAVSTIFFARRHLPGGVLAQSCFPLLVLDEAPAVAMVLPSRFWSEDFREFWTAGEG